jgi:hypothetical protein
MTTTQPTTTQPTTTQPTTTQPTTTQRDLDNSKSLGDSCSGGNLPGGAATGGNAHQGARPAGAPQPSSAKAEPGEPDGRNLTQHPKQTAEVPLGSGNTPEASGRGGFGSHSSEPEGVSKPRSVDPMPATNDKDDKPSQ